MSTRNELLADLVQRAVGVTNAVAKRKGSVPEFSAEEIRLAFAALSTESLAALSGTLRRVIREISGPTVFLRDLVIQRDWDSEADLRRALLFAECCGRSPEPEQVLAFSAGLAHYGELFGADLSALRDDDLLRARALVRVAFAIDENMWEDVSPLSGPDDELPYPRITDPEVVALVCAHASRAEDIVEYVRTRCRIDTEGLREYLDSPAPLSEGAL